MRDKEVSNENLKNKKPNSSKKSSALLYLIVPAAFTVLALVLLIPAIISADKTADKYISELAAKYSNGNNNLIFVDDEPYKPDYTESGEVALSKSFTVGDRIGTLICEDAGVNLDVFYGSGVQIFARGAGLNSNYSLFGENGSVLLESFAFSGLENISADDIIRITTVYGTFEYRVTGESIERSDAELVLCSSSSKEPFAENNKLYICADKISGPALKIGEVQ